LGSGREPATITLVVGGSLARTDVPCLCARLRAAIEAAQAEIVVCDVGAVRPVDVGTLDALARLQLTAHRSGGRIRLRRCSQELAALLAFAGLAELVPVED
jgi:ABC-type transporter Mla MlaB component